MSERVIMISRPARPDEVEAIERKGGIRLNQTMRQSILKKAYEHAFSRREKALTALSQELGHLAMVESFGAATLKTAAKLGAPWVTICRNAYGEPSPDGTQINFRVGYQTHALLVKDPLPTGMRQTDAKYFTVKDERLKQRIADYEDERKKLLEEQAKTTATLNAMLGNIQTLASLERTWPEGKPFYKHIPTEFPFRHQVPATLVADLNKALGI